MAKQYGLVYIRRNKTKPHELGHWNEKKRLEAVTTYMATGNAALTSRIINVPEITVRSWMQKDWWKDFINEATQESDLKLNKNLEKIVEKSLSAVNEILTNGDYVYDGKLGKVVRVPPKLRDVNKLTGDLIDKQMMLRKQHKPVRQDAESTEGRLLKLAEQFTKLVHGKTIQEEVVANVVDGEFEEMPPPIKEQLSPKNNGHGPDRKYSLKENHWCHAAKQKEKQADAIHEEREERLQEGASLGAFQEAKSSKGQVSQK